MEEINEKTEHPEPGRKSFDLEEQKSHLSDDPQKVNSLDEDQDSILRELDAKKEEIHTLNDKYLRLAAEFDNFKRRAQRDQQDGIRFANERLIKDLLPVIDNLERAIQCGRDQHEGGGLLEGVELTYKQFLEMLGKLGVRQISSLGELFDPSMHQAVAHVESDTAKPNTVVEEFQKGFFLHERILRPAMVTVAKEQSTQDPQLTRDQDSEKEGAEG